MVNFDYTDCFMLDSVVEGLIFYPVTAKRGELVVIVEHVGRNLDGVITSICVNIEGRGKIYMQPIMSVGKKIIFRGFDDVEIFQAFYM